MEEKLSQLETEYDLQGKITDAYQKLTRDTSVSKSVRRSREQCYHKAYNKVRSRRKCFVEQPESLGYRKNPITVRTLLQYAPQTLTGNLWKMLV